MKRILCLLLLSAVGVFLLSACDTDLEIPGTSSGNETTLNSSGTSVEETTAADETTTSVITTECEHAFGEWVTLKEATCKEEGLLVRTCTKCSYSEESIAQKSDKHVEIIDKAVEATCTKSGLTEGKHCSVCGTVIIKQVEVPMVSHTYDGELDATCNACGFVRIVICKHDSVATLSASAPTCTAAGLTEGQKCNTCGEILIKQNEIPALGHSEVTDKAIAPTCTTTGLTEGKHCSVCNEVTVKQNFVGALGHTEVTVAAVEATCTKSGLTERRYCSTCKAVFVEQTTVPAKGHTAVIDRAVEATCTSTGLTEGKHCSVCSTVLVAQKTVNKKAHSEGDRIIDREATLTTAGEWHTVCTVCGTGMGKGAIPSIFSFTLNSDKKSYTLTSIGDYKDTKIEIPSSYEGLPVTAIGEKVFYGCEFLTQVVFPDEITSIGKQAFMGCYYLTDFVFPEGLESIGDMAFGDCLSITSVVIPDSVTYTGNCAFAGCSSLKSAKLSKNSKELISTFITCKKLSDVALPEGVTTLFNTFSGCEELKEIEIPSTLTEIGNESFYGTGIRSIVIPSNVTKIESLAFSYCKSLEKVTVASAYIGWGAFEGCEKLVNLTLLNGVEHIDKYAFKDCTSLERTVLPCTLKKLSEGIFEGCNAMIDCFFDGTNAEWLKVDRADRWFNSKTAEGYYIHGGRMWEDSIIVLTKPEYYFKLNSDGNSYTWGGYSGNFFSRRLVLPSKVDGKPVTAFELYDPYGQGYSKIYFEGTAEEWNAIAVSGDTYVIDSTKVWFYSESEPAGEGLFWRYVDGLPVGW